MSATEAAKLTALRAELPAVQHTVYLNAGTNGPLPRRAVQAMYDWAQWELSEGRVGWESLQRGLAVRNQLREAFAALLGTHPERVAITASTTAGISTLLADLHLGPGDEVVTIDGEHGGVLLPLALWEQRAGIRVRLASVGQRGGDISGVIADQFTPRTRLVIVSQVSWSTGARYALEPLVALCRTQGVLIAVDGAQAAGAVPVAVDALGVDYYAFSGQKWLLGPAGTGGLVVHPDRLSAPLAPHPGERTLGRYDETVFLAGTRRFELAGKVSGELMAGALAATRWLLDEVGLEWLFARAAWLAHRVAGQLRAIPGVEVSTPAEMGTLICFRIGQGSQEPYLQRLLDAGFRVRIVPEGQPGAPTYLRLSVGWWNSEEELGRTLEFIARLAATA
ncbi:MAG: aminotransferase class V-fold PLP-dependent enzyme [Chloroflexi bacterium]|nr:aminotransferase class V-fold PLP-dependent enzyme [Chloroflexota bacterium]